MAHRSRVLLLDAHDSFSNNITALLATQIDVDVCVLQVDDPYFLSSTDDKEFTRELRRYDAVVCGPGPGSPDRAADVGLMRRVWAQDGEIVPALGICLGFQSLLTDACCGGRIRRLREGGLHGIVRRIEHRGTDVFERTGEFKATLYHSLGVDMGQDAVPEWEWESKRWETMKGYENVVALGWVEGGHGEGLGRGERILTAARHRTRPFWGLQYHPESVCTEEEGHRVIRNWFKEAMSWNERTGRTGRRVEDNRMGGPLKARCATRPSLLSGVSSRIEDVKGHGRWWRSDFGVASTHEFTTLPLSRHVQVPDIVEALCTIDACKTEREHIVLDSANAASATGRASVRGRYSIIALGLEESPRIEYRAGSDFATVKVGSNRRRLEEVSLDSYGGNVWAFLAEFHRARCMTDMSQQSEGLPFLGGFMGFVTYEQGLNDIGIPVPGFPDGRGHQRPDVCFAWVTKSVVVGHEDGLIYVQNLRPRDGTCRNGWSEEVASQLTSALTSPKIKTRKQAQNGLAHEVLPKLPVPTIHAPKANDYERKVRFCQDAIAAGESYELCLTDQTTITLPATNLDPEPSWSLFKTLRSRQPAPFASYLRLGGATLVSASPERFLHHNRTGLCSMRPMKGTVRKGGVNGAATLAEAESILHVPKEEAENLMIVDLVRHDLHAICGPGGVAVPKLMHVEEYESVFQMITVVEGQLPGYGKSGANGVTAQKLPYTGLDVLAASLPPGSMTGAPKKRSCEILRRLEGGRERSLYAGVVGYICVTGAGDWSVTIRSLFRWDDEKVVDRDRESTKSEVWGIGAGGAVTILSTPEGEREEMFTKLAGPLGVFGDAL